MTTPMERARALRFAHEVLSLVRTRADVPEDLRRQAHVTLRHLPAPHDIAFMAKRPVLNWWIQPEVPGHESMCLPFDGLPSADQYLGQTTVWTAWLEHTGDNDMLSTFVVVGFATDEKLARAMFAGHFGIEYAKLANVEQGLVANEVTERLISPTAFERMDVAAQGHEDFCMHARLDHAAALNPTSTPAHDPGPGQSA